jgi:acetate kinase
MDGASAVVFTGGIGENSARVRAAICEGLGWMGLTLDSARNAAAVGGAEGPIHSDSARLQAYVIPTDEELLIARDTIRCIHGQIA